MSNVTLSLPESMRVFIEEQIAKSGFNSQSDYLLALIREAQTREGKRNLEAKLLEGLQSPLSPMTPDDWAELKQQVLEQNSG